MTHMNLTNVAVATSAFACAALLSFGWSEQGGLSLSIETAQARVGRPLTPMSVAGVARRQNRRAAYGYGAGVVGAGVAAAGVGTAAAVAAAQPWNGYGPGYDYRGGYYGDTSYVDTGSPAARSYYRGARYDGTEPLMAWPSYGAERYQGILGPGRRTYYDRRPYLSDAAVAARPYYGGRAYAGDAASAVATGYGGSIQASRYYEPGSYYLNGVWYSRSAWPAYKARNGIICDPGTRFKGDDGLMYVCQ